MAKLRKGNRVENVNDDMVEPLLKQGYDQIDHEGNVIRRALGGRVVSIHEHNKALEENDGLKSKIAELQNENKVSEEVDSLKAKIVELQDEIKILEEENIRLDKIVKGHQQRK